MASIAHRLPSPSSYRRDPNPSHNRFRYGTPAAFLSINRRPLPTLCRCRSSRSDSQAPSGDESGGGGKRWDELIQDMVASAVKRWDDYVKSYRGSSQSQSQQYSEGLGSVSDEDLGEQAGVADEEEECERDWDWERWKLHFAEMEDQERIVSVLRMQLRDAVTREDYVDAAKLKLAISVAEKNDTVGTAISDLIRAVEEERYKDAAFLRDHGGVGLVGWWAGISKDSTDPYGQIIHISAEHGKYVAKSYSSRQLTSARPGFPLFEIYFTIRDGYYKQQAVYLKRGSKSSVASSSKSTKSSDVSSLNQSGSSAVEQNDIYTDDAKTTEEDMDDESDISDGLASIQNVLRDMIPGVKVKVLKVVSPGKVDRDLIAKVIEQIMEDEDESTDEELEGIEVEDVSVESDIETELESSQQLETQPCSPSLLILQFFFRGRERGRERVKMQTSQKYSASEISLHTTKKDCWLVIHGKVYDVTTFLEDHPGGDEVLLHASATGDATQSFEDVGHSSTATGMMQGYLIGTVDGHAGGGDLAGDRNGAADGGAVRNNAMLDKKPPASGFADFLLPVLVLALAFGAWYYLTYIVVKAQ